MSWSSPGKEGGVRTRGQGQSLYQVMEARGHAASGHLCVTRRDTSVCDGGQAGRPECRQELGQGFSLEVLRELVLSRSIFEKP